MTNIPPHPNKDTNFPQARPRKRHFSAVWLIPIVAAMIAIYLGVHDYAEHGPTITVTFKTAQGLIAGQTQVKYKAVPLGTVENIKLDDDQQNVVVTIKMTTSAKPFLTDQTRFWVVRPELNTFNASDIETLVTGSYIQVEPGDPDDKDEQRHFAGLENPPADRSDEAGRIFVLKADKLDSINVGSPVYYRDINVGQVLGYDVGNGYEPITVSAFVREPYDKYVHKQTQFWNASGLSIKMGPQGFHLETHSLRTVLAGGVAFLTPPESQKEPEADANTTFMLYDNQAAAETAVFSRNIPYSTYFKTSVKDVAPGTPVLIYGIQVGQVTGVKLMMDAQQVEPQARVDFNIQPQRVFGPDPPGQTPDTTAIMRQLVAKGMRVKLDAGNLVLGQKTLVLEFTPNAEPVPVVMEKDITVLPSTGSSDNVMEAVSDIAGKLNQIPFEEIGNNLNNLIKAADQTVGGKDMQQAVHDLSTTMANAADLTHKANENMTPALQKLPDISAQLQEAAKHANNLMSGLDSDFGQGTDFQRDAKRTLDQVNDAARSIRLLADFLERHPEALLSGKSYQKDKP